MFEAAGVEAEGEAPAAGKGEQKPRWSKPQNGLR